MARDSLAELHTEPFAAEREWTVEDIPVLTASVTVPRPAPAADRVSRRIYRYYQLQCRSYLRYCERWLPASGGGGLPGGPGLQCSPALSAGGAQVSCDL